MIQEDALLAGPYGRALCEAVAVASAPETYWWRLSAEQLVDALSEVRPDRIRRIGERRILGELRAGLWEAVYWQEPDERRAVLALPEVIDGLRPIARALAENPATSWWSDPVDPAGQNIVELLIGDWAAPLELEDARHRLRRWRDDVSEREHEPETLPSPPWRSASGPWWSAPHVPGIVWTTRKREVVGPLAPHTTEDDMGWSRARVRPVDVDPGARIREIDSPEDWARLVDDYPLEVTREKRGDWWRTTGRDGRWWIPDWAAVAERYDAVHVTVAGYLATAGQAVKVAGGATVLAGWGPDQTCWLRPDRLAYTGVVEQWHAPGAFHIPEDIAWRKVPSHGPDGSVHLRPLSQGDEALLAEATLLNVNWNGDDRFTAVDVAADPALAHYTRLRPERGDFGLVAEVSGRPVGVVWLLFLDSSDPGYGHVADDVPELSVCVWPGYRGSGLGRMLIDSALRTAREPVAGTSTSHRVSRVSLSVAPWNPAARLYRSIGFEPVPSASPGTMVFHLR
ncbi:GNAT family N-acetyltransferase [Dietzia maris]|uniref:GNAT family N-acetyltransferase n=1 Tax=Dietzia maris TaxID=37915 RepID=UPI0037CC39EC